ncbi:MAG: hypothetical protein NC331_08320 [Lachnospiraceae bacterium]|nr:hypothetical protein [Lachnospiraceae bacterium]MCM1239376.1 hypothetical protein [Lachnospiraceae bacterium]
MNKNEHSATMYERVPAVAALNKVPGFDPLTLLRRTVSPENGEEVLQLDFPYKKLWFRLANPKGRIKLNALRITEQLAIFEAQVYLDRSDENPIGSFTSSCTREEAPGGQYIKAAQQAAMDEALSDAGFGVQFADVEMGAGGSRYGSRLPLSDGQAGHLPAGTGAEAPSQQSAAQPAQTRQPAAGSKISDPNGFQQLPTQAQPDSTSPAGAKTAATGNTAAGKPIANNNMVQKQSVGMAAGQRNLPVQPFATQNAVQQLGNAQRQAAQPAQAVNHFNPAGEQVLPVQSPAAQTGQVQPSAAQTGKVQPSTVPAGRVQLSTAQTEQARSSAVQTGKIQPSTTQVGQVQSPAPQEQADKGEALPVQTAGNQLPVQPQVQKKEAAQPAGAVSLPVQTAGSISGIPTKEEAVTLPFTGKEEKAGTTALNQTHPGTALPGGQAQEAPAPRYTPDMSVEEILSLMTPEEAGKVVVDVGVCKGQTIAEVAERRPPSLKFYCYGGYKGDNNILRAAARIMLDSLEARKAG